jgi:hypothetical protein
MTFIFGLAYSDIYGFKVIFDEIIESFSFFIDYIHNTKFYHIFIKILTSIKGVNEELIKEKTDSIEILKEEKVEIKVDDFSSE